MRKGSTRYDAVHAHLYELGGLVTSIAAVVGIPKRIAHSHNEIVPGSVTAIRRVANPTLRTLLAATCTNRVACSSAAWHSLFGPAQPGTRDRILHCGIDLKPFRDSPDPNSIRDELGINESTRVIGHVGRLETQKNHKRLIEIFAAFRRCEPDSRLVLVGEGTLHGDLVAYSELLGVLPHVMFLGARTDVPRLMTSLFDVFLFPSFHEGLGNVLIEAQAAGLRSVVSSTIPPEVDILPDSIVRRRLEDDDSRWIESIQAQLQLSRIMSGVDEIEGSHFDIVNSAHGLELLYRDL
jgi:glycosyltransferase involved in cell wall biosynthesis